MGVEPSTTEELENMRYQQRKDFIILVLINNDIGDITIDNEIEE